MITLATQYDPLGAIYRQSMKPYVDNPARYVAMPPVLPVSAHAPRLDIESLVFLLETDDRKFVRELMVEQDRYDLALQAVNQRSKVHHDIAQPRLAAANVKEHSVIPREELEEVLGPTLVIELRRATNHAFEHIEGARKLTHDVAKSFSATMRKRFGKKGKEVVYLGLRELDRSAD